MLLVKEPKHPERHLLVERIFDTILYAAAVFDFGNLFTTLFPTPHFECFTLKFKVLYW